MFSLVAALVALSGQSPLASGTALPVPRPHILVFSKTSGFRHDSIPEGIEAIQRLGRERDFSVEATEDSSKFNAKELARFDGVVFLNTTGDILDDAQQAAFERFVEAGGGYIGVHSASDTEYSWPWYGDCVGAYFSDHPAIQEALVLVEDRAHPSTVSLPNPYKKTDEWYNFRANPRTKVRVLASLDETTYQGGKMDDHPIVWCRQVGLGRSWYTNLGHRKETYQEKPFLDSLAEGIVWACQGKRPQNAVSPTWGRGKESWTTKEGSLSNGGGGTRDIYSEEEFGDQLVHVEFKTPPVSNSGVYLQGRYEVQIFTSFGKTSQEITFADAGGIYQRWVDNKGVDGSAPITNASLPAGVWQTMDVLFKAPRFDKDGKKTGNARIEEVRLNGVVVQRDVELRGPTGGAMGVGEVGVGPLRLQGDHGPIEYRNVWVVPLGEGPKTTRASL